MMDHVFRSWTWIVLATGVAYAGALAGCVSSMQPIYDEPEQAVAVDRLVGDWTVEDGLMRIRPAEVDGLAGYRAIVIDPDADGEPRVVAEGEMPQPHVAVMDLVVGEIEGEQIAQVRFDREASQRLAPDFDWHELIEPDAPHVGVFRLRFDERDGLVIFQRLRFNVVSELVDTALDPPNFRSEGRYHISLDDEPARVRAFLSEYADDVWDEEGTVLTPAEAADAPAERLERYSEQMREAGQS